MNAYTLTKKNQPSTSWEIYIILANDEDEMKKLAKEEAIDINEFDFKEQTTPGIIHTDIY